MSKSELIRAQALALEKGRPDQAEILENYLEEGNEYVQEAGKIRPGLERKRFSNASRFARY
jgi:hypothetical protein